jgi:hypothetical protein
MVYIKFVLLKINSYIYIIYINQTINTLMNNNNYLSKLKFYDESLSLIELFQLIKKIKRETKLNHILYE